MYQKGFTLVELLVAIAIVSILAAIALGYYPQWIRKTMRVEAMSTLALIREAEMAYCANDAASKCQQMAGDSGPYSYSPISGLPWTVPSDTQNFSYSIVIGSGEIQANCNRGGFPNFKMSTFSGNITEY